MNWLQKIQHKPQEVKLQIMWTVAIVVAVLLVIVWIVSARYYKKVPKDTSAFKTIEQGVNDVKENYKK
ncbi:MAG TPA: hypothetical protein VE973_01280 [Candidatus Limnocylindria bacterium]|nr:hypothetical protein [Candidatus Limnocylindria bacterium]